jgi:hypothetical protein
MTKNRQSKPCQLRQCKRCSVAFTPKRRQVYCSPKCRKQPVRIRHRRCPHCTNKFRPKRKDAKYCSQRCRSRAGLARYEAELAKQELSKPSKPLETRQCVCGRSFDQNRHWQQYCSPKCGARYRQERLIERKARELNESSFNSPSDGDPG